MTDEPALKPDERHSVIWLQPWCEGCARHCYGPETGRQWCQDDAWGECEECGQKSVKYTLADDERTRAALEHKP